MLCRAIQGQDLDRSPGVTAASQTGSGSYSQSAAYRPFWPSACLAVTLEEMKSSSLPSSPAFPMKSTA